MNARIGILARTEKITNGNKTLLTAIMYVSFAARLVGRVIIRLALAGR